MYDYYPIIFEQLIVDWVASQSYTVVEKTCPGASPMFYTTAECFYILTV